METEKSDDKELKIKSLENTVQRLKRTLLLVRSVNMCLGAVGLFVVSGYILKEDRNSKYNQIFLQSTKNLPTEQDTIDFYQAHDLGEYIINGKPVEIPYKEIKRIVKGEGK